ncbi:MAG: ATP-binding protein [Candidatus Eremiobacteraeota bacterium]|nr:ATP-binding protein [Candidatus Eremiobacteraeota bacterium]
MAAGWATWTLKRGAFTEAAVARKEFVAHLRQGAATDADYSAAELIFGELVANALTHARVRAVVRLWFNDWAHLSVHDDGGSFAERVITPAALEAQSGRGLYIVKALARAMRIEGTGTGWVVTAELPVAAKSDASDLRKMA